MTKVFSPYEKNQWTAPLRARTPQCGMCKRWVGLNEQDRPVCVPERDTQSGIRRGSGSLQGELSRGQRDVGDTGRRIEKQAAATNPQDALATTTAENLIKNGMTFCLCHSSCWKRGMKY